MKALHSIIIMAATLLSAVSCRMEEPLAPAGEYGHVQFRVVNSLLTGTKAETGALETLAQARKVGITMMREGSTISQTIPLNSYSDELADYGVQSDRLGLLAGEYTIVGFFLYDALDNLLISCGAPDDPSFTVIPGGLVVKDLGVSATGYGKVSLKLVKNLTQTKAPDGASYPFTAIRRIDVRLTNVLTRKSYEANKVKVTIRNEYEDGEDGRRIQTSIGVCDTLLKLPAGEYQVTYYRTYADLGARTTIEARTLYDAQVFRVEAFREDTEALVPIALSRSAEYIRDYLALREIWEALDGPHWKYTGEEHAKGANWNFDKDIDLWGRQPGVSVSADGRVTGLDLSGFGISGALPDAIGQLTELQLLYLGTHNESIGGSMSQNPVSDMSEGELKAFRMDFHHRTTEMDLRENMSEELRRGIALDASQRPILHNADRRLKDINWGVKTNGLTGISRAIMRLTRLQQLFIANSPITTDGFFTDISEDSPFHDEELDWANMEELTDIEIYNCFNLEGLPLEMLTSLPDIQALNVSNNRSISDTRLRSDWTAICNGSSGGRLQILYIGFNNLRIFPSRSALSKMVKLGYLACNNCQVEKLYPFGGGINLAQVILDHNRISSVPTAPDGYFCGMEQLETFSISHNLLTQAPDIFNAKSIYVFDEINLSHNSISSFEHGESHKGYNAKSIDLSYNDFREFPSQIFKSGSPCEYFICAGNGIETMPKGSLTGPKAKYLMSLDLSYNKLKELPASDFAAANLPYFYGVDLSYNCLDYFPTEVLDGDGVTVLVLRHQRDEEGNRTLRNWPAGLYSHCPSLQALYLSSNDIRRVDDIVTPQIPILEISDNPNISITLASSACSYIQYGYMLFVYDKTQDIRGCPAIMQ